MERWRQPVKPVAIETDSRREYFDGSVWRQHIEVTFSKEDFARIKLGYVCLRCWEPHERPWPDACSLCSYSINEFQTRDVEHEFVGEKHVGPSTSYAEEIERLREENQRRLWTPGGMVALDA